MFHSFSCFCHWSRHARYLQEKGLGHGKIRIELFEPSQQAVGAPTGETHMKEMPLKVSMVETDGGCDSGCRSNLSMCSIFRKGMKGP